MAIKIGRSFADLINALVEIIVGLKAATGDAMQKAYAMELGKYLNALRALDEKQEKASTYAQPSGQGRTALPFQGY